MVWIRFLRRAYENPSYHTYKKIARFNIQLFFWKFHELKNTEMCDTSNEIVSSAINIFLHSVYYMSVRSNWGCFFMKRFLVYVNISLAIHTENLTPDKNIYNVP